MPVDVVIARWVGLFWVVAGVSHIAHPSLWARLLLPLRDREDGGFILAGMSLPVGLLIIVGHNIWVWDLPVIVTIAGWLTTLKCVLYLWCPKTHRRLMPTQPQSRRAVTAFRSVGSLMIILGLVTAYDAFWRR